MAEHARMYRIMASPVMANPVTESVAKPSRSAKPSAAITGWLLPGAAWAAPETATSILTVVVSLGLILGGFVVVAWLARRYLPGMRVPGGVRIIGSTMVGARERVVVVEIDNTRLVLGVGGGQVRLLHSLPKPVDPAEPVR